MSDFTNLDNQILNSNSLMIQGCTSDAGKTVMVAGLGRLLARQNKSVAPFKPQNMALNSAVTVDGGEIGRAQAVQAQACKIDAHTDMNPILLKPSSDTGAQVIVHGHPIDSMQASQYHDYKKVAMQAVLQSHQRLGQQYDQIIVEGAGSPAEINLRHNDIANMGFAEAVDCPVILIADIDRGGVFAHLVGTLDLLSKSEQARVVGFIINRFRGDISLLQSGLDWLEKRTKKPVLGVIPYLPDFFLDAEDGISNAQAKPQTGEQTLNVVVPVLPRISNHTDFDALRLHPQVNLKFISIDQACPAADLIILPGSKNVIDDLNTLKAADWQAKLDKHLRYGGKLMGVCGGYQMLGQTVDDPQQIESSAEQTTGFGFFEMHTSLKPHKQLRRISGALLSTQFDSTPISGYEIHCGVSEFKNSNPQALIQLDNNTLDGAINQDNNVIGSYLHGLFDQPDSCNQLLNWCGSHKAQAINLEQIREQQLERLADCLQEHLSPALLDQLLQK